MVLEQFKNIVPDHVATYINEHKVKSAPEAPDFELSLIFDLLLFSFSFPFGFNCSLNCINVYFEVTLCVASPFHVTLS